MAGVDRLTRHYDDKYATSAAAAEVAPLPLDVRRATSRSEAALSYLASRVAGCDVVEIGAGDGVVPVSLLAGSAGFASYTLGDLSPVRCEALARRLSDPRLRVAVIDGDQPLKTLAPECCDVVVTLDVIEHLIDPIEAMIQTRQLLRPGGFMYLNTPNVAKWTHRLQLLAGRFPSTASTCEGLTGYDGQPTDLHDEGHFHYFTFPGLTRLLIERAGFARVEVVPYHPGPAFVPPALGHRLARLRPTLFSGLAVAAYV